MASYGSLIFYGKNGLSHPYCLSYGKTTIGTSADHHIRIKGDDQLSCILDTNEVGVTILVNENVDKDILINSVPAQKYNVIVDGDHLEVGKKKFKYLNPSLDKVHLEQTQKTLDKRLKTQKNLKTKLETNFNSPTQLKRLKNVVEGPSKRRFSTGSKINELRYTNTHTSTPQSASKKRVSQRMLSKQNSMLASVKENEVFDFQSPIVNCTSSPIPKKKTSLLTSIGRRNKSFSGKFEFSSPSVPAKNKTYSGNISDVSENVTTPENNITAASITPLNVSKKSKRSLNRSRTLSYVDFPDRSSTPKSAIKLNRSSSLYRPVVEDITPASPIPSSPRNSSVMKQAFTQRRSVNFNLSSSTDNSFPQNSDDAEEEISLKRVKRKRDESTSELVESTKKMKNTSEQPEIEDIEDQNSLHNSSLSGINHLSDSSFNSNKNNSARSSSRLKKKLSLQEGFENRSMISWNVEMSSTDMSSTQDLEPVVTRLSASTLSSSQKSIKNQETTKINSKIRSKSFNLDRQTNKSAKFLSKTLDGNLMFYSEDRRVPSEDPSVFDKSLESSMDDLEAVKISSTPLVRTRGRISNMSIRSTGTTNTTRMSLNVSPITPKDSKPKGSEEEISVADSFVNSSGDSTNLLFGSKLNASLPECNDSTNKFFQSMNDDDSVEDSVTLEKSKLKSYLGGNNEDSLGNSERSLRSLSRWSKNDKSDVAIAKELLKTPEPRNSLNRDLSNVSGLKKLLKSPRVNKSPKNDLSNVGGLKKLLKTPRVYKSPKNDLTNVRGLKKLLNTPKIPKSPKNDLTNIGGVRELLKTPYVRKSPKNDLTVVRGVKKLMTTPKNHKSPKNDLSNIVGVKKLLKSPILQKSPKNDLTDIRGVKKLMSTPKVQKSPENDLSNVAGVRELLRSPIVQNSPRNDLTDVRGVKKLMTNRMVMKSPKNDLTQVAGVKKLLSSPKQCRTPKNDLTDIKGVKQMFKTPKEHKEPVNDLLDVRGVKQLLRTPKNKAANESHDLSGIDILFNESQENKFDKLLDKKPIRTYGKSPKEKKSQMEETKTPEHVLKWLEEQSSIETPKEKVEYKRTRGRKNEDATKNEAQSSAKNSSSNYMNEDILESSTNVEPFESSKKGRTNRKRGVEEVDTDIATEVAPQKRGKYNRKIDQDQSQEERKISEPMKKGRNCKKNNDSLKEPIMKRSTRSNKQEAAVEQIVQSNSALEKADEEESSIRRNNRRVKKEVQSKTAQADENDEKKIDEKELPIKKSTRRTKKQDTNTKEKDDEVPTKRTPRRTRKGNTDLDQSKSKKADEDENNEKKSPIKKTTRTKNHEETYEEKQSPKKRSTRRTRKENTELDHSKTKQIEDGKNQEKNTPIKKITRKKAQVSKQKDETETTQDDNEKKVVKKSPIKRNTRKRKMEDKDAEQEDSRTTEQVEKNEENDEEKLPNKKGTKRTKKEIIAGEQDEQKRTTRKNKGKNQKYNEDEWDTPVKKNDQKLVSFKAEVDFVQTPSIDSTHSGRSLRRRNVK